MNILKPTTLAKGLSFPEGPRWHNGKLFFSDFTLREVRSLDLNGEMATVAKVPNQPSGLGWLPNGDMLIVSMLDHKVLRKKQDGSLVEYADLSPIATGLCNDMVVDANGRAYVGNFGGSNITLESKVYADLAMIDTDGIVTVAARDLLFPNGTVITPDQHHLIIAETLGQRLTMFDIDANGKLHNRRLWADLSPICPDGICLDSAGGIWVATVHNAAIRVEQGGAISHTISTDRGCYACALGGENGNTLYLCVAGSPSPEQASEGQILSINVATADRG